MHSLDNLPDEALLRILWHAQDARTVARCGALNRRWWHLSSSVDRLKFVFNEHESCAVGDRDKSRCTQLGNAMYRWLQRVPTVREVRCVMNCLLYQEVIDWLQPALERLENLEIRHDMDWYQDTCECPGFWRGLSICKHLRVLHLEMHYHQVAKCTLASLVSSFPLLRELHIAVSLEPTDLKLTSNSLKDLRLKYLPDCVEEDKIMTVYLEMPELTYLMVHNACVELQSTPSLQRMHVVSGGIYYSSHVLGSSAQPVNLRFLSIDGDWSDFDQIKSMFSVTSTLEELQFTWDTQQGSIPLPDLFQTLPKLRKVTLTSSRTLDCLAKGTTWEDFAKMEGLLYTVLGDDSLQFAYPSKLK